jgi:hypothetical protein
MGSNKRGSKTCVALPMFKYTRLGQFGVALNVGILFSGWPRVNRKKRSCESGKSDSNTVHQFDQHGSSMLTLDARVQYVATNLVNEVILVVISASNFSGKLTSSSIQHRGLATIKFQRLQTCYKISDIS